MSASDLSSLMRLQSHLERNIFELEHINKHHLRCIGNGDVVHTLDEIDNAVFLAHELFLGLKIIKRKYKKSLSSDDKVYVKTIKRLTKKPHA